MTALITAVQHWEGYVTAVLEDTFRAKLITVTGSEYDAVAEIYKSKVHPDDIELVEPGAVFDWIIYADETQSMRFKCLEPLTEDEIEAAMERGRELMELFT